MSAGTGLARRIRAVNAEGRSALLPYLVAGYPASEGFDELLLRVAARAEVIELGLPFSDPIADGPVIAAAARAASAQGVHLGWLLELVGSLRGRIAAGLVLMSYLNPLLAGGLERTVRALAEAGFEGLIVPDLLLEESVELREIGDAHDLALIQLATPLTPPERLRRIAGATRGFLYAVTRTGITGARADSAGLVAYLDSVRAASPVPVCAGFGLREPAQVRALAPHANGLVVGTALVERLSRGEDLGPFLDTLRAASIAARTSP